MPHVTRCVAQLVSPVTWTPSHDVDVSSLATPARLRYVRAPVAISQQVHEYMLTLWDLGIDIDDEMLERMLDAAEKREREAAAREARPAVLAERQALPVVHEQVVYYMRMDRLVKIGTSGNIRGRFEALMPQGVMAIEWGDHELERERHRQFVDLHSHGEWFHLEPALAGHIVEVRERFAQQQGHTVEDWLSRYGATWSSRAAS